MEVGRKKRSARGLRRVFFLPSLIALIFVLSAPAVWAQDPGGAVDPYPLRPADTSSPRATLRSFLDNANESIEEWRADPDSPASFRPFLRALETLDFSTTPHSNSYLVRTRHFLLLKELLDRIDLPPDDEIPGDTEVAEEGITSWTVPDTSIRIARIEAGPRQGEFQFSAGTVERLPWLYNRARHLPYRPGATDGIYLEFEQEGDTVLALQSQLRLRLTPADTSSPRSTLYGLLDSVTRAHALIMEADAALRATPPTITIEEALQAEQRAHDLLTRAVDTLDLIGVPRALRAKVGLETVLLLKEVLDRLQLPPEGAVPDARMAAAARSGASTLFDRTTGALRWRYPNSQIEITEIVEGNQEGQFLFSAATVAQIADMYEKARDFPYRRDDGLAEVIGITDPLETPGFYEYYIGEPGYLVHNAHYLSRFIDSLPAGFKTLYLGQTIWQWIGLLLGVVAIAVAGFVVHRVVRGLAARRRHPWNQWLMILPPIVIALVIIAILRYFDQDLKLTGAVFLTVAGIGNVLFIAVAAWIAYHFCTAVAETVIASPRVAEGQIDATLWRVGARLVGFFLGAWLVIEGAQELGADMIPLIAGLGVGGLAVALAAQKTIANFIGSLILFANKPVRVGDFCGYGDQIGTVEAIGLHSTRIRSLERTVVTVPNAEFSEMKLDNFGLRDRRLLNTALQLRYETTPEQLRYVLTKLREMLLGHPMVTPAPARVRFVDLGAYSLNVEIFAYLLCQDQDTFLAIKEDILLRIVDIVKDAGTEFAFPSQTAYLTRDKGLDADRVSAAETEVEHWRTRGKLPFPEFEEEERERLENLLDYPPKGSPDYRPPHGASERPPEPPKLPEEVPTDAPERG